MGKTLRKQDFKLGQIHGRLQAENNKSEAQIQRAVFLSQKINLFVSRGHTIQIRLFGYEIPLQSNASRGRCVDLMGYDEKHNLYLIELKDENSREKTDKIEKQITDYEIMLRQRLIDIQKDFKREFFLPIIFGRKKIYRIILAPKQFFNPHRMKEIKRLRNEDIIYADFGGRDIYGHEPGKPVSIHLKNKCKSLFIAVQRKSAVAA